jgi:hypothetical protein
MLDAYTIIGFIGALVLMVGFLLNQIGHWETSNFEYDFINLIGAAVLSVYSWQIGSYPFLILFLVWTGFSLKDVIGDGFKNMMRGGEKKSKSGKAEEGEKQNE